MGIYELTHYTLGSLLNVINPGVLETHDSLPGSVGDAPQDLSASPSSPQLWRTSKHLVLS